MYYVIVLKLYYDQLLNIISSTCAQVQQAVPITGAAAAATIVLTVLTVGLVKLHRSRKEAEQKAKQRWIRRPRVIVDAEPMQCPCDEECLPQHAKVSAQHYGHLQAY